MAGRTTRKDSGSSEPEPLPPLSAAEVARFAVEYLTELTTKDPQGVTSVSPSDDGWTVEIEVIEDRRIPSTADMLALYEVRLDPDGELLSYRRTKRYGRGSTDLGGSR
ncbi:gas vesicle protein [Rhodococcus sp. HM1]|uniref:gas vesicle protein GvpO n=1 Tax=unclassified Rhodococcus (in: high G+C Gram-positive bacteria) TaxID=192944 RepID=UPI0018CCC178|nr:MULTISPECIES: gas vesicle protein [unclassified Rhodococcus (in: high G+C Gram-positive bacteria)]MBH0118164.1 gas vesicle protein [Rhodococcus sp. CX]MCK8673994.1 gas vesicle protein [Rhodococcus sp. HM1]